MVGNRKSVGLVAGVHEEIFYVLGKRIQPNRIFAIWHVKLVEALGEGNSRQLIAGS
jgi:hypothetical protein